MKKHTTTIQPLFFIYHLEINQYFQTMIITLIRLATHDL